MARNSEITPGRAQKTIRGFNPGWLHAEQVLYPLYYLSVLFYVVIRGQKLNLHSTLEAHKTALISPQALSFSIKQRGVQEHVSVIEFVHCMCETTPHHNPRY